MDTRTEEHLTLIVVAIILVLAFTFSCATPKTKTQALSPTPQEFKPKPVMLIGTPKVVTKQDLEPKKLNEGTHLTLKNESWWKIANEWYQDPFQWPILYKHNRHYIPEPGNPDLIIEGEHYLVPLEVQGYDRSSARRYAESYGEE